MNTLQHVRKPVHNKCYGVEIECLISRDAGILTNGKPFQQFWYAGYDGSIHTDNYSRQTTIEFVSQPLPYNATIKQINWLAKKFKWEYNHSCGIHVHVSKAGLSIARLTRFAQGIAKMTDDQFESLFGRSPNNYCKNRFDMWDRYSCVNFTNDKTIEFRMFPSGDAAWAIECLRRVRLMCRMKGAVSYDSLLDLFTKPEELS